MNWTATGPFTSSLLGLERLLKESAAFQSFVGAASESLAAEKIKFLACEDEPEELSVLRPLAVIAVPDGVSLSAIAWGASVLLDCTGAATLELVKDDEYPDDRRDGYLAFCSRVDAIISDIKAKAGQSDYMPVQSIRPALAPMRSDAKDNPSTGPYWSTLLLLTWK